MVRISMLGLWQQRMVQRQQQYESPGKVLKTVEIPRNAWTLVQNLAGKLRVGAGYLVERAIVDATKNDLIPTRRRSRKGLEMQVTSLKISPETWRIAHQRAREGRVFFWQYVDDALHGYDLGPKPRTTRHQRRPNKPSFARKRKR